MSGRTAGKLGGVDARMVLKGADSIGAIKNIHPILRFRDIKERVSKSLISSVLSQPSLFLIKLKLKSLNSSYIIILYQ